MSAKLGLCLELENLALTQYQGLDFESLALAGGELYAAGPNGLFCRGGADDDGRPIRARLGLPATDFGEPGMKTLRAVQAVGRAERGLVCRLVGDDGQSRDYPLVFETPGDGLPGTARVEVGRDGQGRFWRLELENRDGGDFQLSELDVAGLVLDRRSL